MSLILFSLSKLELMDLRMWTNRLTFLLRMVFVSFVSQNRYKVLFLGERSRSVRMVCSQSSLCSTGSRNNKSWNHRGYWELHLAYDFFKIAICTPSEELNQKYYSYVRSLFWRFVYARTDCSISMHTNLRNFIPNAAKLNCIFCNPSHCVSA